MFNCCQQNAWVDSGAIGQDLPVVTNSAAIAREVPLLQVAESKSSEPFVVDDTDAALESLVDESERVAVPGITFSLSAKKDPKRMLGLGIVRSLPQVTGIIVSIDEDGVMGGGNIKKWDRIMSICGHDAGPDASKLRTAVAAGAVSSDFFMQLQRPQELVVNLERNKGQCLGLSVSYCTSDSVLLVTQVVKGTLSDGLAGKYGIRVNDCIVEVNKFKDDSDAMLQQIRMESSLTLTVLRYAS